MERRFVGGGVPRSGGGVEEVIRRSPIDPLSDLSLLELFFTGKRSRTQRPPRSSNPVPFGSSRITPPPLRDCLVFGPTNLKVN